MTKLYIAYGSNMDEEQMRYRCPDSKVVGTGTVEGYGLLFKGGADHAYATIGCVLPKEQKEEMHMTNTQEYTTMEQLMKGYSTTCGAVLQYGPLVLATNILYQGGFTAEIYEFVESPE